MTSDSACSTDRASAHAGSHTHVQLARMIDVWLVVNPGHVGLLFRGGHSASYSSSRLGRDALIEIETAHCWSFSAEPTTTSRNASPRDRQRRATRHLWAETWVRTGAARGVVNQRQESQRSTGSHGLIPGPGTVIPGRNARMGECAGMSRRGRLRRETYVSAYALQPLAGLWLDSYAMTVNGRIMSLSSCSTMWQWWT